MTPEDEPAPEAPPAATRADVLRFAGAAVGLFVLVNLAGEALRGPFDTLSDWVTVPGPRTLRHAVSLCVAMVLVVNGWAPIRSAWLRAASGVLLAAVAVLASVDTGRFYAALAEGSLRTPAVIPASLLVVGCFGALAAPLFTPPDERPPWTARRAWIAAITAIVVAAAIPLIRIVTFGPSRYERHADCAVVFGARVWNDGRPSHALSDRVDESIELYRRGLVGCVVMSGAVDPGNGFSEPRVMADRAVAAGVPEGAIVLDEGGVDTASSVRNTARILRASDRTSAIAVSHYYHEPRVKMLFQRAGIEAYTVPAHMRWRLAKEPYFVLREVAAYYHSFLFE